MSVEPEVLAAFWDNHIRSCAVQVEDVIRAYCQVRVLESGELVPSNQRSLYAEALQQVIEYLETAKDDALSAY